MHAQGPNCDDSADRKKELIKKVLDQYERLDVKGKLTVVRALIRQSRR